MDEGALRRLVGGPHVMRDQLSHLLTIATRDHVEIRILPYDCGAHASPDGAFRIFDLPEPYPAIAYILSPAGGLYVEGPAAARLEAKLDHIRRDALATEPSLKLISAIAYSLH
jgi:hypothetical protein